MNKKFAFFSGVLALLLLAAFLFIPASPSYGAPMAAPTPVTFSGASGANSKVTFFNGNVTADTRICFDLSGYNKIDLQYLLDQGTVNTTTVKLQWSNDNANFLDTATVASANVADTSNGQQYLLFGQYNCIFVDVANTNPLGTKVFGVAK